MRVLVACEFSGRVRDAFRALGHDAYSCDLLPSMSDNTYHYQCDALEVLRLYKFDLLIAFPPCTYLTVAGNRAFKENPERYKLRLAAFDFVRALWSAPVPRVCIENPAGYLSTHWQKPSQIINPYLFGDPVLKRTCLWLRGLPLLYPSVQFPSKPLPDYVRESDGKNVYFVESCRNGGSGLNRQQYRSMTLRALHLLWLRSGSVVF